MEKRPMGSGRRTSGALVQRKRDGRRRWTDEPTRPFGFKAYPYIHKRVKEFLHDQRIETIGEAISRAIRHRLDVWEGEGRPRTAWTPPPPPEGETKVVVGTSIPEKLYDDIDDFRHEQRMDTRNDAILRLITEGIEQWGVEPKPVRPRRSRKD